MPQSDDYTMKRSIYLLFLPTLVLAALALPAAVAKSPATAPATSQPAGITEGLSQLRKLEKLLRAKDADGFRKLVLISTFPDAQKRVDEFAAAVKKGVFADARVIPFESKLDGPVVCIIAAFLMKPDDPNPDVEPSLFVQRERKWRLIHASPEGAKTIMNEAERAATDRLVKWVDEWREANRESIRDRVRKNRA
jgi:hypothetical protein